MYFHHFKQGDEDVFVECSKADYDSLALPNAPQPTPPSPGMVWVHSVAEGIKVSHAGKHHYGVPPEGTFVDMGDVVLATHGSKHWIMKDADIDKETGVLSSATEKQLNHGNSIL